LIALVAGIGAAVALLLDVLDLAVRAMFPIAAAQAAAAERREAKQADETHEFPSASHARNVPVGAAQEVTI
jgi:hypothetical protein